MARFVTAPLKQTCSDIRDIVRFLRRCNYVLDKEQFDREDYWLPPEEFETTRKGDCEDFALWTWRQLIDLGYRARFVVGVHGRYGEGHAWVTFEKDGKHFLVEPMASVVGDRLPRLSTLRYEPETSVEWDGEKMHYFAHEKQVYDPGILEVLPLALDWALFWSAVWLGLHVRIVLLPIVLIRKALRKNSRTASKEDRPL